MCVRNEMKWISSVSGVWEKKNVIYSRMEFFLPLNKKFEGESCIFLWNFWRIKFFVQIYRPDPIFDGFWYVTCVSHDKTMRKKGQKERCWPFYNNFYVFFLHHSRRRVVFWKRRKKTFVFSSTFLYPMNSNFFLLLLLFFFCLNLFQSICFSLSYDIVRGRNLDNENIVEKWQMNRFFSVSRLWLVHFWLNLRKIRYFILSVCPCMILSAY